MNKLLYIEYCNILNNIENEPVKNIYKLIISIIKNNIYNINLNDTISQYLYGIKIFSINTNINYFSITSNIIDLLISYLDDDKINFIITKVTNYLKKDMKYIMKMKGFKFIEIRNKLQLIILKNRNYINDDANIIKKYVNNMREYNYRYMNIYTYNPEDIDIKYLKKYTLPEIYKMCIFNVPINIEVIIDNNILTIIHS